MRIHRISFKHAIDGIWYVLKSQPNFRFHSVVALFIILLSLKLEITKIEWIVILFTILLVLVTEMINTAIEAMTDLLTQQHNQFAKISKDVSAGMVLITASLSVVVGLIIFLPYII